MTLKKKIVLIGQSGVGKTSLVQQYVSESFSDNYLTTVGVSIKKKSLILDNQNISLIIWDLAGDLNYGSTYDNYIRGASGVLLVADGTNTSSVEYATSERRINHPSIQGIPKLLLLNKCDLKPEWRSNINDTSGIKSLLTSAKTNENVANAFEGLCSLILTGQKK